MSRLIKFFSLLIILGLILWQGCATTNHQKTKVEYRTEIVNLQQKLRNNPKDTETLCDLGIIAYELKYYPVAKKYLTAAYKLNRSDPRTITYLGMTLEALNSNMYALKLYKKYNTVSRLSPYRKTMAMRYQLLKRKMIRHEMHQLLANERNLSSARISPKAVAIFPFNYQGMKDKYAPLGKGVSEMMITDLSQVKGLQVIERVRLQMLMDEMALGQSGMVDESSAPRFGKLLGAGKIIHGSFDIMGKKNLQLDVGMWDIINGQYPEFTSQNDELNNLFKLEKDLVFDVIDEMGIELTPSERTKIQHIPTKNMQAFLAYSIGLEMEDAGKFDQAAKSFQKALTIDPNFNQAGQKMEESLTLASVSETYGTETTGYSEKSAGGNLVNNRLNNLASSIGSIFIPGQDSRKSVEEATESGADVFEDLPLPPEPPERH